MKTHIRWALCGSIGNGIGFLIMLMFVEYKYALGSFLLWELIWLFVYMFGDLYLGLNKDALKNK